MNIYEEISRGHLYQKTITGNLPDYSKTYVSQRYDTYSTNDLMSKLRFSILFNVIGKFKSVTDFGYGNGSFIRFCEEQGKESFGYDISNYPVPENCKQLTHWNDCSVDVMTFFDSLEHITDRDLSPMLKQLNTKYVCISVPWCHFDMGKEWFMNWKHRRENEHLHHFDSFGLTELLTECNYKILYLGNDEDMIRIPKEKLPNILTVVAKKVI